MDEAGKNIKDKEILPAQARNNFGFAQFACQKAEKLCCALYKVTDFIADKEPIKWQMRKLASKILCLISSGFVRPKSETSTAVKEAYSLISGIVSLCEVARGAGAFSEMNFSILKDEYLGLQKMLERKSRREISSGFSQLAEVVHNGNLLETTPPLGEAESYKGHLKDREFNAPADMPSTGLHEDRSKKESHRIKDKKLISLRREQIISFLRRNGKAGIKDIADAVSGCGEKTIQRQLVDLVSEKIVKKSGQRRWSQYELA